MICRDFDEKVNLYLDHALSEQESRQIEDHMDECPLCKTRYLQLKQVVDALGSLEEYPLPEDFELKLREKLLQQQRPKRFAARKISWAASVAAGVIVVAGFLGALGSGVTRDISQANTADETSVAVMPGMMKNEGWAATQDAEEAVDMAGGREIMETTAGSPGLRTIDTQPKKSIQDKLIYTGETTLLSYQFDADLQAVLGKVKEAEGFVDQSTVTGLPFSQSGGQGRTAYLVIRVPQTQYETLGQFIQGIGQVSLQRQAVTNITQQYTEVKIRIANLEGQILRLQELMSSAEIVEDMIALQEQLTAVTSQLEIFQSQLASMDMQVAYSTLNVTLNEVATAADSKPMPSRSFGQRAADALRQGWNNFVLGLEGWALGVVQALPVLITLAVILAMVLVVICIIRRVKRKKK